MFDVIRDFLLEPALLTVALLCLPALVMGWLAGARGRALLGAVALGEVVTLVAILLAFSWSVLAGDERLRALAWPGCGLLWWVAWAWLGGRGRRAPWLAALVTLVAWGLDTFATSAILFE